MTEELIAVREARRRVLAEAAPLPPERVELDAALGRTLAEDVRSEGPLPSFDASAMDGFAARAGPAEELEVVGESRAGHPAAVEVAPGQAIRISTGAMVPPGGEAVVPVERAELLDRAPATRVRLPERAPGDHIRRAGEEVAGGRVLLGAGERLGPPEVALAAAAGRDSLLCGGVPRVVVVTTGDELVAPGRPLAPGQVRDSNGPALAALAATAGARVARRTHAPDSPGGSTAVLADALELADVVCVAGGVSVGEHDHVKPALARLGVEERFWGVSLKPGKPAWFGARGRRLVFGLPGNPVSAMVTFELFVRPALAQLAGATGIVPRTFFAALEEAVARNRSREQAIRCRVEHRPDGAHALPTGPQGSHRLTSMVGAGALLLVAPGEGELPGRRPGRARAALLAAALLSAHGAAGRRATAAASPGAVACAGVRPRDPRRLIRRRRHARGRVRVIVTRNREVSTEGGVDTVQCADIVLPRSELDRVWSPEYLERLARTYWVWIERISLGLLRVLYTATSREVVLLGRPLVLLRFLAPEYDVDATGGTVTWRINRGLLVAREGRGNGFLRMKVERRGERPETGEVTARITSQVSNFYPTLRGSGRFARIGRFVYRFTQLKIHVLVTNAFLRSLANLDLAPSVVGSLRGRTPGVPDEEEFAALRRLQEERRRERGALGTGAAGGEAAA